MNILFIHQNFPGQYVHVAPALAAEPGNRVVALAINKRPVPPGVEVIYYTIDGKTTEGIHPWVADFETKVIRAKAVAAACARLKESGFRPDIVCAHHGWGETLFVKDVFPDARLLAFIEFYYQAEGADHGFDAEFEKGDALAGRCRLRARNASHLLTLEACDWGVCPTEWQRSTVPAIVRDKISVIFDGTDTTKCRPNPNASITLKNAQKTLTRDDEVITFVNRNLEPYRGFHIFMRALPEIQKRRPDAWTLIVEDVSYGAKPADGRTYRQMMMDEVGNQIDMRRVRFLGRLGYDAFITVLQLSSVHVYLTYPFVLSWSMLEAMACGAVVVGSATPPVQEVIVDGVNGLLVDFFSGPAIAEAVDRVLDHPDRMREMGERARQTVVDGYDLNTVCLPRHLALIRAVAAGALPPVLPAGPVSAATEALRRAVERKRRQVGRGRRR
jgi:glycosyltransferase involved in cell wall biosynthesis